MEEKKAKLEELMKDEAFLNAMFSKESSEEVQKLFAEKGVELTIEEVEGLAAAILQAAPEGNGELSEDALDSVAGGGIVERVLSDQLYWIKLGLYLAQKYKRRNF